MLGVTAVAMVSIYCVSVLGAGVGSMIVSVRMDRNLTIRVP